MMIQQKRGIKMSLIIENKATVVRVILVLSLVTLVVVACVVESSRVRGDDYETIKQHVEEQDRILVKRQSDDATPRAYRTRKRRTTTTSTTQSPSSTTSTTSTLKPDKKSTTKGKYILRNSARKKSPTTKRPSGSTTKKSNPMTTKKPMSKERKRRLYNTERTSLDHMLAGIKNWVKVLNETNGVPFNEEIAGEFFHVLKKRLRPRLTGNYSPDKLEAKYMDSV